MTPEELAAMREWMVDPAAQALFDHINAQAAEIQRLNESNAMWERSYHAVADLAEDEIERADYNVDTVAMLRSERDALAAQVQRVRDLHSPFLIYDDCGHAHTEEDVAAGRAIHVDVVGYVCDDAQAETVCRDCCTVDGYHTAECATDHGGRTCWPCPTIVALDGTEEGQP